MPIVMGKNSQIKLGNLGAVASSGGTVIFPAAPAGSIYILDWFNIIVRDATAAQAYIEVSINLLEGVTPVILNLALTPSGIATVLGTYSVHLQNLGFPVLADGASTSATVTVKDVTGAASVTTITNGLIIGAWGFKQFPYQYMG